MVPVGPVSQTPHEWPFTWMVYWGVNDNPVVPDQTYMLKVWRDENDAERPGMNIYRTINDVYPDGILYEGTTPRPDKDMWGYVVCMNLGGGDNGGYTDSVGLAGYWKLDEAVGDTVADSSGHTHDGVRQGDATWASGKIKGGLCLDGEGDYVDLGDSERLKPELPLTIAAWIKHGQVGNFQTIFNTDKKDYDAEHRFFGIQLFVRDTGTITVSFGDGLPNYSKYNKTGTTVLQPNVWYHVAAVLQGPGDIHLYINGQDDGGVVTGTGGNIAYSDGASQIGCRSGNVLFFEGCIDDVVLFDVALTPDQMFRLYKLSGQAFLPPCGDVLLPPQAMLPGDINRNCIVDLSDYQWLAQEWLHTGSPLLTDIYEDIHDRVDHYDLELMASDWLMEIEPRFIGHWTLDDGAGTLAQDSSYNENHGQLQGDATWSAGQLGGALSLDGDGDYVDLGDAPSLKPDLPLTIAAWIKLDQTGIFQTIFNTDKKDYDAEHRFFGSQLFVRDTGTITVSFGDGLPNYSKKNKTGTTVLQPNVWYHVAAILQGPGDIHLYINGQDDGGVITGTGGDIAYADGSSESGSRSGTALFFHGAIDDLRLYHRALESSEITALAAN
jgi:Concanavalin A-like lectin/glucanases superfamily